MRSMITYRGVRSFKLISRKFRKKISSNQFTIWFFTEKVVFTKFLLSLPRSQKTNYFLPFFYVIQLILHLITAQYRLVVNLTTILATTLPFHTYMMIPMIQKIGNLNNVFSIGQFHFVTPQMYFSIIFKNCPSLHFNIDKMKILNKISKLKRCFTLL